MCMNGDNTIANVLLISIDWIDDMKCVGLFSEFCEGTCANLFAFSPYQLHLKREEFLHYQFLADELKDEISSGMSTFEKLYNLCCSLNAIYESMIGCCWEAFLYNNDMDCDPARFVVRQLVTVAEFNERLESSRKQ